LIFSFWGPRAREGEREREIRKGGKNVEKKKNRGAEVKKSRRRGHDAHFVLSSLFSPWRLERGRICFFSATFDNCFFFSPGLVACFCPFQKEPELVSHGGRLRGEFWRLDREREESRE
jgi:hypothetical protein